MPASAGRAGPDRDQGLCQHLPHPREPRFDWARTEVVQGEAMRVHDAELAIPQIHHCRDVALVGQLPPIPARTGRLQAEVGELLAHDVADGEAGQDPRSQRMRTASGPTCSPRGSTMFEDDQVSSRRFGTVQQVHPFVATPFALSQNEGASGSLFTPSSTC
jgi:hypothetical protein